MVASRHQELGSQLQVLAASFPARNHGSSGSSGSSSGSGGTRHELPGCLLLLNTLEAFARADKPAALAQLAATLWKDIISGAAEACPARLQPFLLLAHGDLKRFAFTYWCECGWGWVGGWVGGMGIRHNACTTYWYE